MFTNKTLEYNFVENGEVAFSSPSNIALVKYWGKHGVQLPQNPSFSITLNNAISKTSVSYQRKNNDKQIDIEFYFHGEKKEDFANKILIFLEQLSSILPFVYEYKFIIHSENTFPHSSGIASSASSMSALAMCLCEIEKRLSSLDDNDYFLTKSSYVARLGSGSASRSIYPKMSVWGACDILGSSDEYAVGYNNYADVFEGINDSIAIVSKAEKAVSSRVGHKLMESHPFAQTRFANARENMKKLVNSLKNGDFALFTQVVESEALELHGLMMNSKPSFILMEPGTLQIINLIRNFRESNKVDICFTLDAGPNVHILYPGHSKEKVLPFLNESIKPLCQDELIIHDHMGNGPLRL